MTININATNSIFTNVAGENALYLLNDPEAVTVESDGFLIAASNSGLALVTNTGSTTPTNEHRAFIFGTVQGSNYGVLASDDVNKPSSLRLDVYQGASVTGFDGIGTFSTKTILINNYGNISSRGDNQFASALDIFGSVDFKLTNTGLITSSSGFQGNAITFTIGGTHLITNSGIIRGNTYAIQSVDTFGATNTASKETISNSGKIFGTISLGNGDDVLTNGTTGTIDGAISMGDGADTFSNFGTVNPSFNVSLDGGADKFIGGDGYDRVSGGEGADNLKGGAGDDFLWGDGGADTLEGGSGLDLLSGGAGGDVLNGGADADRADYTSAATGVTVRLDNALLNTGDAQGDTYISIEDLNGSSLTDILVGNGLANSINGFGGNDTIFGLGGADALFGDEGNDLIEGGAGADFINGGSEIDQAAYTFASTGVVANLANIAQNTGDAAGDVYSDIEGLRGSNFADALIGNAGANFINGGLGNDFLAGGAGADAFFFSTALNSTTNFDRLTDFNAAADIMWLQQAGVFTTIAKGVLAASQFVVGSVALDANDRIIYNQANGNVFYDSNGNAAGGQVLFAQVAANTVLTSADFLVI
ncbi:MAG: calcium-binding protein [Rhizobiaceae bacterium]